MVSCSQEKEGPTEKNPQSPVQSEREALLVGTLTIVTFPASRRHTQYETYRIFRFFTLNCPLVVGTTCKQTRILFLCIFGDAHVFRASVSGVDLINCKSSMFQISYVHTMMMISKGRSVYTSCAAILNNLLACAHLLFPRIERRSCFQTASGRNIGVLYFELMAREHNHAHRKVVFNMMQKVFLASIRNLCLRPDKQTLVPLQYHFPSFMCLFSAGGEVYNSENSNKISSCIVSLTVVSMATQRAAVASKKS